MIVAEGGFMRRRLSNMRHVKGHADANWAAAMTHVVEDIAPSEVPLLPAWMMTQTGISIWTRLPEWVPQRVNMRVC
jgi:hypothetical protein